MDFFAYILRTDLNNAYSSLTFERMKAYKEALETAEHPVQALEAILSEVVSELEYKKKAQILNREEAYALRETIEKLEQYIQCLKAEHVVDNSEAFELIRGKFAEENTCYQDMLDYAGEKLEYAFDFMEIAFGNGQEMIAFVTELNTNFYSVQFLQSYECERYYMYNQNLLFDEKRQNILKRIDLLDRM